MFKNIFSKKKPFEPLDYESRKYFEQNILWLEYEFPEIPLESRMIFLPTKAHFPIHWNRSEENAIEVLKIVANAMQIDQNKIELEFYREGVQELNTGTAPMFLENDPEGDLSAGQYHGKNENGKYEVSINYDNLNNPEVLISTIAHELCHIKLLDEAKIEENDECLTDLAVVFFGFGIFGANASFQFYQKIDRWGYQTAGYLKHDEWAYSLALLAFLREEHNPEWLQFLNPTIKKEFEKSISYMIDNEDKIFDYPEEQE